MTEPRSLQPAAQPSVQPAEVAASEWVSFPGGELEGRRPASRHLPLCSACRVKWRAGAPVAAFGRTLCFQCYRSALAGEEQLAAAGNLNTTSEARFQGVLPLEPVNRARLERLRVERVTARSLARVGPGRFMERQRRALIAARHAVQARAAAHLEPTGTGGASAAAEAAPFDHASRAQALATAIHAAELQLPASWLPFVVSQ